MNRRQVTAGAFLVAIILVAYLTHTFRDLLPALVYVPDPHSDLNRPHAPSPFDSDGGVSRTGRPPDSSDSSSSGSEEQQTAQDQGDAEKSRRAPPRLLVLQYEYTSPQRHAFGPADEIYADSAASQQRNAQLWGYDYRRETRMWVAEDGGVSQWLNKWYCLLGAILGELEKGNDGANWIL